jgi:pimeloyl-ACP methyl ester carboxylesterase
MRVVFVHGACVQDGPWWWHRMTPLLQQHGISSSTPALPSCGETGMPVGPNGPGLSDDVQAVHDVLRASDESTVIVAHSYGGIVAAEAVADINSVTHLLLIASYLPEIGESLATFGSSEPAPYLEIDFNSGTFGVRPELLVEHFLADCDLAIQTAAAAHLAYQSLVVINQPVQAAAWHDVPTTYVVCANDRGTPATSQRTFAERANRVVELDAGHHPFLSQPDVVCDILFNL